MTASKSALPAWMNITPNWTQKIDFNPNKEDKKKMPLWDLKKTTLHQEFPKSKLVHGHGPDTIFSHEMLHAFFQEIHLTSYLKDECYYCLVLERLKQYGGHDACKLTNSFSALHDKVVTRLRGKHCNCDACSTSWSDYRDQQHMFVQNYPNLYTWDLFTQWPGFAYEGFKPTPPLQEVILQKSFTAYVPQNFQFTPEPRLSQKLLEHGHSHVYFQENFGTNREWTIPIQKYNAPLTAESRKYPQLSNPYREDVYAADFYYICREGFMHTLMQCQHCDTITMGNHSGKFNCPECGCANVQFFKMTHKGHDNILNKFFGNIGVVGPSYWQLLINDQVTEVWIANYDTDMYKFQQITASLFDDRVELTAINNSEIHLEPRKQELTYRASGAKGIPTMVTKLLAGDLPITNRQPFHEFRRFQTIFKKGTACDEHFNYGNPKYNIEGDCTDDHFRELSDNNSDVEQNDSGHKSSNSGSDTESVKQADFQKESSPEEDWD